MISIQEVSSAKGKLTTVEDANLHLRNNPNGCTVHEALAPIVFIGQLFSLMPINGYFRKPVSKLKFTLKSLRFVYSCLTTLIMSAIISMFLAYRIHRGTIGLGATGAYCTISMHSYLDVTRILYSLVFSYLYILRRDHHGNDRIHYPGA